MAAQKIIWDQAIRRYRNAVTKKFVSRTAFLKQQANSPRFREQMERFITAQIGAPPSGKNWVAIAEKYPERFADFLEGFDL